MTKRDTMLRALCKSLGKKYRICTIDFERVIYRDFGNGFNVEISGVHNCKADKPAIIYLWFGNALTVRTVHDVDRSAIGNTVDDLYEYTQELVQKGYTDRDSLFRMKYPKTANDEKMELSPSNSLYYKCNEKVSKNIL